MDGPFLYPPMIVKHAREAWQARFREPPSSLFPDDTTVATMLEVAFHASLLREERRGISFRVGLLNAAALRQFTKPSPDDPIYVARFEPPRSFTVAELLRLAPAVDPTKSLFVVERGESGTLCIAGILDFGKSSWAMRRGIATSSVLPADVFTITSFEPGNLVISQLGEDVLILRRGRISTPIRDLFAVGPIAEFFSPPFSAFIAEVQGRLGPDAFTHELQILAQPYEYIAGFVQRLITNVQERAHGGTVIVLRESPEEREALFESHLKLKYRCHVRRAWDTLVGACVATRQTDVGQMTPERRRVESGFRSAITETLTFLAALTAVDGALVITDRMRLLGFGAEILALLHPIDSVAVASDTNAVDTMLVPIDSYGTRHRSAFRFCYAVEDALAFVISQDGGVKAVKRLGEQVIMWPDIDLTA